MDPYVPDNNIKNRNFVSYIGKCDCECKNSGINLFTFNLKTNKEVNVRRVDDLVVLMTNPPAFIKEKVKAIIITDNVFQNAGFQERLSITKKLSALNVPFLLIPSTLIVFTSILIDANVDLKSDETLIIINVSDKDAVITHNFIRKVNGYLLQKINKVTINPESNIKDTKEKLIQKSNPTKIILSGTRALCKTILKHLRAALKSNTVIALEKCDSSNLPKVLREMVKNIYDKSENKYFIIPKCQNVFGISEVNETVICENPVIKNAKNDELPFSKTVELPRDVKTLQLTIFNKTTKTYDPLDEGYAIVPDNCHRIKVTFSIDINEIPSIQHEAHILPEIKNLPKTLNSKNADQIPVIALFDNSSFICIWNNEKKCYEFSKLWNGKYGKNLFLDFSYQKPKIVESVNPSTSTFVVYDILNIMSMPVEALKNVDFPYFKITKDDENPVLLEFDSFGETRKAASPAFLMALLLKQHKKIIRKEMGEKPTKFGFCIFQNFENFEDIKRVEDGLAEACGLLKMGFSMVKDMA